MQGMMARLTSGMMSGMTSGMMSGRMSGMMSGMITHLRLALGTALVSGSLVAGTMTCAHAQAPAAESAPFDLILTGGTVIDGTGGPGSTPTWRFAAVASPRWATSPVPWPGDGSLSAV